MRRTVIALLALAGAVGALLPLFIAQAVPGPPTVSKVFSQAAMNLGASTTLTYTITATSLPPFGNGVLTGIGFTDPLPAGLQVGAGGVTSTTCNGTLTATPGSSSITLAGASLQETASCTFAVRILSTAPGLQTVGSSPVVSSGGPSTTGSASITINAAAAVNPPAISKTFTPNTIYYTAGQGLMPQRTLLTLTLNNPNPTPLTGVQVIDNLTNALSFIGDIAPAAGGTCPGTITYNPALSRLSLANGTIPPGSCTVTLSGVPGNAAGNIVNTTSPVQSTEGGESTTGATANLQVDLQPAITTKSFAQASVPVGIPVRMTLGLTNPNRRAGALSSPLASTTVTDNLPPGLQVAPVPNMMLAPCNAFFATVTGVTPGSTSVTFAMNSWFDFTGCSVSFDVVATAGGNYTNTTQPSTSSPATVPAGGPTASAQLTAVIAPGFSKAFSPSTITVGGTSVLTFSLSTPIFLTGVSFTDNLPPGLIVATPNGLTSTCNGIPTAVPGSSQVSHVVGAMAAGSTCQTSVTVTATATGTLVNQSSPLNSDQAPPTAPATATLTVNAIPIPPTPTPTSTPFPGATATPTSTPVTPAPPAVPVIPQVFQNPAAQGILNGPRNPNPASTPQPRAAQGPGGVSDPPADIAIRPPSTGDGGLHVEAHQPIEEIFTSYRHT